MLEQPAARLRWHAGVVAAEQPLQVGQHAAIEQRATEQVAEAPHHIRGRHVGESERHEDHRPSPRAPHHDLEALERLEEVERHQTIAGRVADGAHGAGDGGIGGRVHDAERAAPQRVAHALGAVAHHLDGVGGRRLEPRLGECERVELQLRPQRGDEIAEHRGPDHAGENLQRTLAALALAPPATVQHRELGLVSRRERRAVQQLTPLHAQRLPVLFHLDERAIAHHARPFAREREEVGHRVARRRRRAGRSLGEHGEALEVEDVPRHLHGIGPARRWCRRGRSGRDRVQLTHHALSPPRARGRRQLGGGGERRRLVAQRRRGELDGILAAQAHAQPQLGHVPARHGDDPIGVAHPVARGIAATVEHRHGHALRGLARVRMHDAEQPDVADGHKGAPICHAAGAAYNDGRYVIG